VQGRIYGTDGRWFQPRQIQDIYCSKRPDTMGPIQPLSECVPGVSDLSAMLTTLLHPASRLRIHGAVLLQSHLHHKGKYTELCCYSYTYTTIHRAVLLQLHLHHNTQSCAVTVTPTPQYTELYCYSYTYTTIHRAVLLLLHLHHKGE
jgi:hypothetical protein